MANRQERIRFAEGLISRDPFISKRELQRSVFSQYGVGLSDTVRRELIRPAKREAIRTEHVRRITVVERRRTIFRPKRQKRYNEYLKVGFTHNEAKEFSKIRKFKTSPAVQLMLQQRRELLDNLLQSAGQKDWGLRKRREEWANTIRNWYQQNGLLTVKDRDKKGRRKPSPWKWYDKTSGSLPPEMQDETPRLHKRKVQKAPTIKKIDRSRMINDYRQKLLTEKDPARRAHYRLQIDVHRRALKGT